MKRRLLRLLLSLYPPEWRDRYAKAVVDLTNDSLEGRETKLLRMAIGIGWSALLTRSRAFGRHHPAMLVSICVVVVALGAVAFFATQSSPAHGPSSGSLEGRAQIRHLRLSVGESSARFTITALAPPTHTFDVLVETAASADVSVYFKTWYGQTLGVQYSTQGALASNCIVTGTQMACLSHFPHLEAQRAGPWTVIASKRSGPPVTVRISITFHPAPVG